MTIQYIVGRLFLLLTLAQTRMLLVYLGKVPSTLGIVGSPKLVFIASLALIVNPIRAALSFVVPSAMWLPALTATLIIMPVAFALACVGVFGQRVAHAAYPELSLLNERGLKEYPIMVIRQTLLRIIIICLLTGGVWYLSAS